MVSKLLIIGNRTDYVHELKHKLTRNKLYTVKTVETIDMAVTSLSSQPYHLVIMDQDVVNTDKIQLAANLKRLGYGFPLLILGKSVDKACFDKVSKMHRLILLEKPFEDQEFFGVVQKLVSGKDIKQKHHRRFKTNQTASMGLFGQETSMPAKMLNLSKGGAHFEVFGNNLEVGKIVQLNVELDQVSKQYQVNARVVWASGGNESIESRRVGVEFIQASDVYRNLLNNL